MILLVFSFILNYNFYFLVDNQNRLGRLLREARPRSFIIKRPDNTPEE